MGNKCQQNEGNEQGNEREQYEGNDLGDKQDSMRMIMI